MIYTVHPQTGGLSMSVTRRQFLVLSSVALGSVPLARLHAWQAAGAPATRFEAIRRNVGYFVGKGGTIGWLIHPDALIVVDTQYPDTAKLCLEQLGQKSSRDVDLLFNTHHHADHTGGNGVFKPKTKKIVAHARVPALQKQFAPPTQPEQVVADATFEKTWSEQVGDERVTARYYGPAHTGGDSVIYFERANVAHMGDLLFHEMHPFVDRAAGASIQNWMNVLETVTKDMSGGTTYIAGHAKPGLPLTHDRKAPQRQRDYFDAVLNHVRKGISAGQSKEEVLKTETLPGFDGYHALPPRLTLGSVLGVAYEELTTKG
jgi:glyoxylase-like metal-dependent hydrolase (beta-lactamase superfamily II)